MNFLANDQEERILFSRKFAMLEPYDGPDAKRGDYVLVEQFYAQWDHGKDRFRIRAPQGLITDVASIPRLVWTISGLTPDGLYRNAAVIHDVGYMWQGKFPPGWFQRLNSAAQWVDVDKKLTRAQILVQAGTSILAIANAQQQNVLSLLGG